MFDKLNAVMNFLLFLPMGHNCDVLTCHIDLYTLLILSKTFQQLKYYLDEIKY